MISNYNEFKKFISNLGYKPKLLLHVCCAPCSSHTLKVLLDYFDITVFYSNDNIYPKEEYDKRLEEIKRFSKEFNKDIKILDNGYNHLDFLNSIKNLENLGERSKRCYNCYKLRLEKTCIIAKELKFDYFTTSLSISPYKNSKWINEIGYELMNKYNVSYLYSDFKKENGYQESIELSKIYNLYRQDYCGCEFSKKEREENERIKEENKS